MNGFEFLVVGSYSSFSVSLSGFSGVCVDEDGNEKKVSPFLLIWGERSEIHVGGSCSY